MSSITSPILSKISGVIHGFLDKSADDLIGQIAAKSGLDEIVTLDQVHSNRVVIADGLDRVDCSETQADALISTSKGAGIGIYTADCVPILIASTNGSAIAAVHAGWKGTLNGIVGETLKILGLFENELGIKPENIVAAIGPSIGKCCYEVGPDVAEEFIEKHPNWPNFLTKLGRKSDKFILDLREANRIMLAERGVSSVDILPHCTKCCTDFNSLRRDGRGTGSQLSFIGLV